MDEEFSVEELKAALRKGVIACKINPVFVGSAYKNKGVQELLDAVVDYLPAPGDVPAIKGTNPETGEEDTREADPKGPFSALAFKIMTDPFVGKLTYLRVYSGKLDSGSYVVNATQGQERAYRPPAADALQPASRHRYLCRWRHRCRCWSEEHLHGRHPVLRGCSYHP